MKLIRDHLESEARERERRRGKERRRESVEAEDGALVKQDSHTMTVEERVWNTFNTRQTTTQELAGWLALLRC